MLHQSTAWKCPSPLMISGARYSGVPQNDVARLLSEATLARPKSAKQMYPKI
jgi:hypothetical protein